MAKGAGYGLGFACFALVAAMAGAAQFKVGGDSGWSVAGASKESYNTWAMKNRFQVGDTLVFVYPKDKDSVLLVAPADYNACNTNTYDKQFTDGNTVFDLDRAGAFFFISGVDANCRANEKLIVMVAAAAKGAPTPSQGSPAATATTPPSSPSGGAPPNSPAAPNAPAGNSTPAKDAPPGAASGAGLTVAGLAGSFVALFGYAMLAF
uniref:Phytocyanin domain-containing protein n=1 Tax=Aegilops tauschii subsp. strangulata TaxID=200361 RepID=A0A453NF23_AEGTS